MRPVVALLFLAACNGAPHRPLPPTTVAPPPRVAPPARTVAPPALTFPLLATDPRAEQLSLAGAHACLLDAAGAVSCWGRNDHGELGDGTTESRATPAATLGLPPVAEVGVGAAHTCARTRDGDVWCWGSGDLAQIGDGSREASRPPTRVLRGARSLHVSDVASCVRLDEAGTARCWGTVPAPADSALGLVGAPVTFVTPTAIPVRVGAGFAAGGLSSACTLAPDGAVRCWGEGAGMGLGLVHGPRFGPTVIANLGVVRGIAAGTMFDCAAAADRVACWGATVPTYFGVGGTDETSPVSIPGFGASTAVGAGQSYVCALDAAGTVTCAGWGELVDRRGGSVPLTHTGAPVGSFGLARSLSVGSNGGCALGFDKVVRCALWRSPNWDQPPAPPS